MRLMEVGDIYMQLTKYGRIGKAPLIRAIGIQKNYKEIEYIKTQKVDYSASGCFACPNYKNIEFFEYMPSSVQTKAKCCCDTCPYKKYRTVYEEKVKYINEKNMYGNTPRLKSIALKLFVIYHFMNPDEHGLVKGLSIKDLADKIGCTARSIHNANKALQEYGYIYYSKDGLSAYSYQILLKEYSSYFLSASEGGRGYATLNVECLEELIKLEDLNQLRIYLRSVLDVDTSKTTTDSFIIENTYTKLRRFLPSYCKPGVIKKALSHISKLFKTVYTDTAVYLSMPEHYHGRNQYIEAVNENIPRIKTYITELDSLIETANDQILNHTPAKEEIKKLKEAHIEDTFTTSLGKQLYASFHLKDSDYKDLGVLCATYGYDKVKECIPKVYKHYSIKETIQSIGALIRSFLQNEEYLNEIELLF